MGWTLGLWPRCSTRVTWHRTRWQHRGIALCPAQGLVFGEQVAPGSSCCHLSPPMGRWPTLLLLQDCLFCSPERDTLTQVLLTCHCPHPQ